MYLQSQDGNVHRSEARSGGDELAGMRKYLQRDVEWMAEAVGTLIFLLERMWGR